MSCAPNGLRFIIRWPKKFVVAGDTLNTPIILQNSGFKSKHIGRTLKLRPSSVVLGDIGR